MVSSHFDATSAKVYPHFAILFLAASKRARSQRRCSVLARTEPLAGGQNAGDGLQIFCRNAQDDSPRCGLAPQRKSALRSFRCRLLGECESLSCCKHTQRVRKV